MPRDPRNDLASGDYRAVIEFNDDCVEAFAFVRISPSVELGSYLIDRCRPNYLFPLPDDEDEESLSVEVCAVTHRTLTLLIIEEGWSSHLRHERYGEDDYSEFHKAIRKFAKKIITKLSEIDDLEDKGLL